MTRILHFTSGPEDWKALLADPEKHWRTGFSARTLAHCWETADGLPPEVVSAFQACRDPLLQDLRPLLAVPEFKVPLPGGRRQSQNDLFVLGCSKAGPVSIMVEGKVSESFGPTLEEWGVGSTPGKRKRLTFLLETLGLPDSVPPTLRYQLFHRAASAILEGERYRAKAAVLLVHSFSQQKAGWDDYQSFIRLFGVEAAWGAVQKISSRSAIPLFAGWVPGDRSFLDK